MADDTAADGGSKTKDGEEKKKESSMMIAVGKILASQDWFETLQMEYP
jgi:hypothetical protein